MLDQIEKPKSKSLHELLFKNKNEFHAFTDPKIESEKLWSGSVAKL